ncbi:hypothetical protein J8F10_06390 [Gemmata sp. G18]|uniref:DUF971 domain-containing protein n=1 Tax=Gemmata palustris TaxID=2822762 RepID=A0ABS5BMK3_9BACT|nr:hypothetical protein [Gemmata palustris]MBP3954908.1 hypothetical protein [Gemmata palustris]
MFNTNAELKPEQRVRHNRSNKTGKVISADRYIGLEFADLTYTVRWDSGKEESLLNYEQITLIGEAVKTPT